MVSRTRAYISSLFAMLSQVELYVSVAATRARRTCGNTTTSKAVSIISIAIGLEL